MHESTMRMLELATKGYYCSQILLHLGLDQCGRSNPDLIRTMAGLAHGAGFGAGTCGALTGGCCLLAFYAGKGTDQDEEHELFMSLRQQLAAWFNETVGEQYGGIDCETIVGDGDNQQMRCGQIVAGVYAKVEELLTQHGFDMTVGKNG